MELRSRLEQNEMALADVSADVAHIGDVAQRSLDGVVALGGHLNEQLGEVREGLGIAPPSATANGAVRALPLSPRDRLVRQETAQNRAAFRALRAKRM